MYMVSLFFSRFISAPNGCPRHLTGPVYTFQSSCYQFIPREVVWGDADADCRDRGGSLVKVNFRKTSLLKPIC